MENNNTRKRRVEKHKQIPDKRLSFDEMRELDKESIKEGSIASFYLWNEEIYFPANLPVFFLTKRYFQELGSRLKAQFLSVFDHFGLLLSTEGHEIDFYQKLMDITYDIHDRIYNHIIKRVNELPFSSLEFANVSPGYVRMENTIQSEMNMERQQYTDVMNRIVNMANTMAVRLRKNHNDVLNSIEFKKGYSDILKNHRELSEKRGREIFWPQVDIAIRQMVSWVIEKYLYYMRLPEKSNALVTNALNEEYAAKLFTGELPYLTEYEDIINLLKQIVMLNPFDFSVYKYIVDNGYVCHGVIRLMYFTGNYSLVDEAN